MFRDLDGAERAVRLGVVERIEDVSGDQIRFSAGRLRLAVDGRIIPLVGFDSLIERSSVCVLRLNDGAVELAYAIEEVIDIVRLPETLAPARREGIVAGVVLLDGRQVEMLDAHWLFADAAGAANDSDDRPLCLLGRGDDSWTREVLRPLVEAAGYRTAFEGDVDAGDAHVVIAVEGQAPCKDIPEARLLRLRNDIAARDADPASVYRYDRAGLVSALQAVRAAGGQP